MAVDYSTVDSSIIELFGETITYDPDGATPSFTLNGFFQSPEIDTGISPTEVEFEISGPVVFVIYSELIASGPPPPPILHADVVTIRSVAYTIVDIEQDESAIVVLHLLEQT